MSERVIREAYLDPSVGFTSANKLYLHLQSDHPDLKLSDVKRWLSGIDSHTMGRSSVRKIRKGSRIPLRYIDEQWDADLLNMQSLSKENNGVRYVLIVIDGFSPHLWNRPLKSKKAEDITSAFDDILNTVDPPERIRTDGGSEFTNHQVRDYFQRHNMYHYVTQSEHKAYFAERVIKTLRNIMSRYMIQKNTHEWLSVLDKLTANYNTTYHSSIRMSPVQVIPSNQDQVWDNQVLLPLIEQK